MATPGVSDQRLPCACCGYRTIARRSHFEICPVCFWEDDVVDNQDTSVLGPNHVTLSVARANYARIGASEERLLPYVRAPRPEEGPPAPYTEPRGKDNV